MNKTVIDCVRLQPLKRLPTPVELQSLVSWLSNCHETCLLEQSQEDPKPVLLPWKSGPSKREFALGVSISRKLPEMRPIWTFYRSLEPEPEVEWAYASPDVSLIHNMLLCFFPDERFAAEGQGAFANPPQELDGGRQSTSEEGEAVHDEAFLTGCIEKLQLDCLLQSLASSRITGKLVLHVPGRAGGIFFQDGLAVHSYLDGEEGPDALLEILTLQKGDFEVIAAENTPIRSITRRMEALLMESAALMDYAQYLDDAKISESTVLEKVPMSYMEYLERMKDAPPLPEDLLSAVAANLDRPSSVEEIATRLGLSKAKWMPVIYGFVKVGVVKVSDQRETVRAKHQQMLLSKATHIDNTGLLDPETGLYSVSAFHFLLQMELSRALVQHQMMSTILLSWGGDNDKLFETDALNEFLRAIELLSRPTDLVCRYGTAGVGIILPNTGRSDAEIMAGRMEDIWVKADRARGSSTMPLKLGIACSADGAKTTEELIHIASCD